MTDAEATRQYAKTFAATGILTLGVTIGGFVLGKKYKHPWWGAAAAFFLVAPILNVPVALLMAPTLPPSTGIVQAR